MGLGALPNGRAADEVRDEKSARLPEELGEGIRPRTALTFVPAAAGNKLVRLGKPAILKKAHCKVWRTRSKRPLQIWKR